MSLNFRTDSVTSPRLTDWIVTASGPATMAGMQVGNSAAQATAAHSAPQAFCHGHLQSHTGVSTPGGAGADDSAR